MNKFEYKVNGETFFSEMQIADVADILRTAFQGKAIGKNPDEHGFRLNVADSPQSFVAGEQVDLEKFNIFRAFPDAGAPFAKESDLMIENARLLAEELKCLGYIPEPFSSPITECPGEGIKFQYPISDGSRAGEKVTLGLVIPNKAGVWPEATPHWLHICPPDNVLEEQVRAHRADGQGCVRRYKDQGGVEWMAISAPVNDFWDKIEEPNGKNVATYLERHVRHIWSAR